MDRRLLICIAAAVLAMLALPALAQPDYVAVVERARTEHIRPGYATLVGAAEKLDATARASCGSDVVPIKAAFHEVMDAWQAVQHIRHGAVAENSRQLRMQFWPDKRDTGGRHLRKLFFDGKPGQLTPAAFADMSVAVQGLQALERLLFDDAPPGETPGDGMALSGCQVVRAITANVAGIARALLAETPATAAPERAETDAREMLTDAVTGLEVVTVLKLAGVVGDGRLRARHAESWRSARSMRNIVIDLTAIRAFYLVLGGDTPADAARHTIVLDGLDAAIAEAEAMGPALTPLLDRPDGPARIRAFAAKLDALRSDVAKSLMATLSLAMGFNALDGD